MAVLIELMRMTFYMGFPVGLFYAFHQPQFYEAYSFEMRQKLFPPQNLEHVEEFQKLVDAVDKEYQARENAGTAKNQQKY